MPQILLLILTFLGGLILGQIQEKTAKIDLNEHRKITPVLFFEYEKISDRLLKQKIEEYERVVKKEGDNGIIINYGKPARKSFAIKQLQKFLHSSCDFDCPRLTFVDGGDKEKGKTQLWYAPSPKLPERE